MDMHSGQATTRGMAIERTALAWNRSGLAIAAIAGSIAKSGAESGHATSGGIAAAALMIVAVGVWVFGNVAYADRRRNGPLGPASQRAALRLICVVALLCAAISFAFALLA